MINGGYCYYMPSTTLDFFHVSLVCISMLQSEDYHHFITEETLIRYFLKVLKTSLVAQMVKCLPIMQETRVQSLCWEDSPEEGNDNLLQYPCLENAMDRGAWRAIVHGVTKSQTRLSDFTFTFTLHVTEVQAETIEEN